MQEVVHSPSHVEVQFSPHDPEQFSPHVRVHAIIHADVHVTPHELGVPGSVRSISGVVIVSALPLQKLLQLVAQDPLQVELDQLLPVSADCAPHDIKHASVQPALHVPEHAWLHVPVQVNVQEVQPCTQDPSQS